MQPSWTGTEHLFRMGSHPVFCVSNPVRVGVFAALVALLSGCAGYCGIRTSTPPLRFERDGDVTILINDDGCTLSGGEPSRKRKKFWPW